MTRSVCTIVVLFASLLFIGPALAQAPKTDAPPPPSKDLQERGRDFIERVLPQIKSTPAQKAGPQRLDGVVQKVDGNLVMVRGRTFDLSAANLQGYESIAQIREGDSVQILYKVLEGKAMASAIAKTVARQKRPVTRTTIPPPKPIPPKPIPPQPVPPKLEPPKTVPETPAPAKAEAPKPVLPQPVPPKPEAPAPVPDKAAPTIPEGQTAK